MNGKTRKRELPHGWYPASGDEVMKLFQQWDTGKPAADTAMSVIVPHAGWYYSGKTAFNTFACITKKIDTIVIAGGHLGKNDPPLAAKEEKFNATIGTVESDQDLLSSLAEKTTFYKDSYPDNTVEINLPMVKYFFPEAKIIWLRIPPDYEMVVKLARDLHEYSEKNKRTIAVAGSTDLTHYGFNYGFHPHGTGKEGLEWVRKVNDREFISYISDFQIQRAIEHSLTNMSSCSPGAAALAAEYAFISKFSKGRLVNYHTSHDISPSDSFVGYAGIIYCREHHPER